MMARAYFFETMKCTTPVEQIQMHSRSEYSLAAVRWFHLIMTAKCQRKHNREETMALSLLILMDPLKSER